MSKEYKSTIKQQVMIKTIKSLGNKHTLWGINTQKTPRLSTQRLTLQLNNKVCFYMTKDSISF